MPDQVLKGLWPVLTATGSQDQVVRAGKGVNAVDLNETEALQHTFEVSTLAGP